MKKHHPARTEVICDACEDPDALMSRQGRMKFEIAALDFQGAAVADQGFTRDLCDSCLDRALAAIRGAFSPRRIRVIFDGPPGPEAGRFVEVEDAEGKSIRFGEWEEDDNGVWALAFDFPERP